VATQRLLACHNKAQPGETIKGVTTDLVRNHAYDYPYEGGCWMTQRNPNFPDIRPYGWHGTGSDTRASLPIMLDDCPPMWDSEHLDAFTAPNGPQRELRAGRFPKLMGRDVLCSS